MVFIYRIFKAIGKEHVFFRVDMDVQSKIGENQYTCEDDICGWFTQNAGITVNIVGAELYKYVPKGDIADGSTLL